MTDSLDTIRGRVASYLWTLYLQQGNNSQLANNATARSWWLAANSALINSTAQQQFNQQQPASQPPPTNSQPPPANNPAAAAILAIQAYMRDHPWLTPAQAAAELNAGAAGNAPPPTGGGGGSSGGSSGGSNTGDPNQVMGDYYEKLLALQKAEKEAAAKLGISQLEWDKQKSADQLAYQKGVAMGFIDGKPTESTVARSQDIMSHPENSALFEMQRKGLAPGPEPGKTVGDYLSQALPNMPTDPTDPNKPPPITAKRGARIDFTDLVKKQEKTTGKKLPGARTGMEIGPGHPTEDAVPEAQGFSPAPAVDADGPAYGFAHASEARAWAAGMAQNSSKADPGGIKAAQATADALDAYRIQLAISNGGDPVTGAHGGYPDDYQSRFANFYTNAHAVQDAIRQGVLGAAANPTTSPYDPSVVAFHQRMGGDPHADWDTIKADIAGWKYTPTPPMDSKTGKGIIDPATGLDKISDFESTLGVTKPWWYTQKLPENNKIGNTRTANAGPQDYYKAWVTQRMAQEQAQFMASHQGWPQAAFMSYVTRHPGEFPGFTAWLKTQGGSGEAAPSTDDWLSDAVTAANPYKTGGKKGGVVFGGEPHWIVNSKGVAEAAITEDDKPELVKGHGSIEVIPLDPKRNAAYDKKKAAGKVQTDVVRAAGGALWSTPPKRNNDLARSRATLPDGSVAETTGAQDGRINNGQLQNTLSFPGDDIDRTSTDKDAASVRQPAAEAQNTYSTVPARPDHTELGPAGRPWTLPPIKPIHARIEDGGVSLLQNVYNAGANANGGAGVAGVSAPATSQPIGTATPLMSGTEAPRPGGIPGTSAPSAPLPPSLLDPGSILRAVGSHAGDSRWNQTYDYDNNGVINLGDVLRQRNGGGIPGTPSGAALPVSPFGSAYIAPKGAETEGHVAGGKPWWGGSSAVPWWKHGGAVPSGWETKYNFPGGVESTPPPMRTGGILKYEDGGEAQLPDDPAAAMRAAYDAFHAGTSLNESAAIDNTDWTPYIQTQTPAPQQEAYVNTNTPLEQAIDKYAQSPEARLAMRVGAHLEGGGYENWAVGDNGLAHGPWQIRTDVHPVSVEQANNVDFSTEYMSNDYNLAVERVKREDPTAFQTDPVGATARVIFYAEHPKFMYNAQRVNDAYHTVTSAGNTPPPMRSGGILRYTTGGNMGLPSDPSDPTQRPLIGSGGGGMIGDRTIGGPAFGYARGAPYASSYRNIPGLPGVSVAVPWKFSPRSLMHAGTFGQKQLLSYYAASGADPSSFADSAKYADPGNTQTQYSYT